MLSFPAAVAVGSDSVYVADSGHFRVVRFSLSGRLLGFWGSEGSGAGQFGASGTVNPATGYPLGPTSLAVDWLGNVFVADTGNQRIEKFSSTGAFEGSWAINPADYIVREMAVTMGPHGTVVLAMTGSADCPQACAAYYIIERMTTSGAPLSLWSSNRYDGSSQGMGPILHLSAASASDGTIFVAVVQTGTCGRSCPPFGYVQKWSVDGHLLGRWNGLSSTWRPTAVAVGPRSWLYVADADHAAIERRSAQGGLLSQWGIRGRGPGQLTEPWGLAIDRHAQIWIADSGNDRIQKFSPLGRAVAQWPSIRD